MNKTDYYKLIPVGSSAFPGEGEINTVNARELQAGLGSISDHTDWIKYQIRRAMLTENQDYIKLLKIKELSKTGQKVTEYFLTLDAAKHVAMMSQTEKGREIREYFIEVEKAYREAAAPSDDEILTRGLLIATERLKQIELDNQRLSTERDEAVRTKAWISTGREGTMFSKLGVQTKQINRLTTENEALKDKLGIAENHMAARAIPWLSNYFNLRAEGVWVKIGHKLREISIKLGEPIAKVADPRYPSGSVNAYTKRVIDEMETQIIEGSHNIQSRYLSGIGGDF